MHTLIVILGPTGVGKSDTCIKIAQHFKTSIINADSRQIYKEIPIGTAAPTKKQLSEVKHYLVGIKNLEEYYSAAMFENDVISIIHRNQLENNSNFSLMSGGSMMYIDAVCNGIDDIPSVDDSIRNLLKQRLETEGLASLVNELKTLDPEHWAIVDKNNQRRVIHALEICHMTGKTYTSFRKKSKKARPFNIIKIGINRPREELYNRINARVIEMINNGLIEEAMKVYPMRGLNSLNTVGYKELFEYFDGSISKEKAIEKIQSNTREYARKQLTWFKRDNEICWFYPNDLSEIIHYIEATQNNINKNN